MIFSEIIEHLQIRLSQPLPGLTAHLRMASESRLRWLMEGMDPSKAKKSGVLVLMYPVGGDTNIVLIQRPDYEGMHGGQVSLPGGKREESDANLIETALRETQEELGVLPHTVSIIGTLSELYIPPSNYLVLPVVGFTSERPAFFPDPIEVEKIIEVSIGQLSDPKFKIVKEITVHGYTLSAPCYTMNGATIWGATAMILAELEQVIRSS
ncbi:MAG: CoA pyrophosphatase [Bacteroidales bacterium]|nr:CoA pyrophosphatase [Bacteroidales bacterium]